MPYDDDPFDDTPLFVAEVAIQKYPCQDDEYTIVVQMSSKLFSGTDDKVEIRLYDSFNNTTEWLELDKQFNNGFERLSTDIYCIKPDIQVVNIITTTGIRKFGNDDRANYNPEILGGEFGGGRMFD